MVERRSGRDRRTTDRGTPDRRRGRPTRAGEPASERISIWLTPTERAALEHAAAANHQNPPAFIRDAINEAVADLAERRIFRAG
jgi:hypothetical protein